MGLKIPVTCFHCMEAGRPVTAIYLELQDVGPYRVTCHFGHPIAIAIQEQRFQLLFELGIHALLDGYPREAVADFSSSMERFHEFFFRIAAARSGADDATIDRAWKAVAAQSERQLGLFTGSYLISEGDVPRLLAEPMTRRRNEVIHKGILPSHDQAVEFGQAVLDVVRSGIAKLKAGYSEQLTEAMSRHLRSQNHPSAEENVGVLTYPTLLSLDRDLDDSLLEALSRIARSSGLRPAALPILS